VLVNLVEKQHITRRLQGKAFFYIACVPKAKLLETTLQTLARIFAGGSRQELVMQLLEKSDLKSADLELLRRTAAGAQPKSNKVKSK